MRNSDVFTHIFNHIGVLLSNGYSGGHLPLRGPGRRRPLHQYPGKDHGGSLSPGGSPPTPPPPAPPSGGGGARGGKKADPPSPPPPPPPPGSPPPPPVREGRLRGRRRPG